MKFIETSLPGVILIEPRIFGDSRGFFMETWHRERFRDGGIDYDFVQDNHSRSLKNTLRGMHYQLTQPQGKLVRAISGEIYDVAIDIRKSSPNFGKWVGAYISEENRKMLWVPPGFAHGFLVTSDSAEVCYKCTDYYAPESERSLLWNDKAVDIKWPLDAGITPLLSDKDKIGKGLIDAEVFLT